MPPIAHIAFWLSFEYTLPAKVFFPSFQIDMWLCMPLPLSKNIGLGMNVAVLPGWKQGFLTAYLYWWTRSPAVTAVPNLMPISHWPAVATSWWWRSTSMPMVCMLVVISLR